MSIDAPPEGSAVQLSTGIPVTGTPNSTFSHRYTVNLYVDVGFPADGSEPVWPTAVIDAESGEVLSDTLSAQNTDARAILSSLTLETGLPKVWPFVDGPVPPARRPTLAGLSFPEPSRESGLLFGGLIGYCLEPGCTSAYLRYGSSIMYLYLDESTGAIIVREGSQVAPELAPAFERFRAAVTPMPGSGTAEPILTGSGE